MKHKTGVLVGQALVRFLLLVIVIRLVRDTSIRMMYPFLPEYARGLGITLAAMGVLLTLRTALVLLAPVFGNLSDQRGNRRLLQIGFALQGAGLLGLGLAQGLTAALLAILVLGLSDAIVHPLMQAYVSEHSPVYQRGRSLAIVEYSWAITGIVILPIVGWLIAGYGWQMPFRLLSLGSVIALLMLLFVLPGDPPRPSSSRRSVWTQARSMLRDRSAGGTLLSTAAIYVAAETVFVVWGAHLERNFDLGPAQIGQVAAIIGSAELVGSVVSSVIIDRTGKRRGVIGGVIMLILILALMPLLNRTLWSLIVGLALVSTCIEYAIVSSIPLIGQQRPGSRATMLAMGAMVAAVGRSITDTTTAWLFENIGFLATVLYAFLALLVALWALWRMVEERQEE